MWRRLRNTHVLLHLRANGDCPVSLAMTHMRRLRGQRGHESTGDTQSALQCRCFAGLAHRHVLKQGRDNQEEFPAPSVQAAPKPAGPSRPASVPDRLSRLMTINLVYGNGSALKRL